MLLRKGIQTIAKEAASRIIELDSQGVNSVPVASARNASGAPPPGFSRISSATPPQMKPVLKVTITSGTRDTTTRRPLIAPTRAPAQRIATASPSAWPNPASSIVLAASTFETAITEPMERSMPPEITINACAAAAKASGSAAIASDWASKELKLGWIATVAARNAISSAGMPNSVG